MRSDTEQSRRITLSGFLDHFIPADLQVNPESHRRARMFMLSHVFGPILGNSLPAYLYVMGIARDYRVSVFFFSILAFWVYPFLLRWTGRYQLLAFVSVQNLIFCALWACYAFGGFSSPFLPWILIFPLLAFLYLPPTGWVRNVLLAQIFGSLAVFVWIIVDGNIPATDIEDLQVAGMLSMAGVATYFAMMSLYFAKMFHEQRNFTRELNALVSTSDNVRNLTISAQQAGAAKANFVASMSHELRTPLNAIIGYSQLLIEEAMDEEDAQSVTDLGHVHTAGSDLLRLIDDILDYSRIDAGKMPLMPDFSAPEMHADAWLRTINARLSGSGYTVEIASSGLMTHQIQTDWNALGQALRHACSGIAAARRGGRIVLAFDRAPDGGLSISIADIAADGTMREPITVEETFEHRDDASSTKYGGTGIEIALSAKFAQLLGGEIGAARNRAGKAFNRLHVPDLARDVVPLARAA